MYNYVHIKYIVTEIKSGISLGVYVGGSQRSLATAVYCRPCPALPHLLRQRWSI
jgi:hypothetical protein